MSLLKSVASAVHAAPMAIGNAGARAGMAPASSVLRGFASGGAATSIAGAAAGGVMGSYYREGGVGGAFRGAIAGAALGSAAGFSPRALRAIAPHSQAYSSNIIKMAGSMESRDARLALFGGGSLLGGMAFGGNRSHKRGFNQNRGNSINR